MPPQLPELELFAGGIATRLSTGLFLGACLILSARRCACAPIDAAISYSFGRSKLYCPSVQTVRVESNSACVGRHKRTDSTSAEFAHAPRNRPANVVSMPQNEIIGPTVSSYAANFREVVQMVGVAEVTHLGLVDGQLRSTQLRTHLPGANIEWLHVIRRAS
jgi:hypothetical protein